MVGGEKEYQLSWKKHSDVTSNIPHCLLSRTGDSEGKCAHCEASKFILPGYSCSATCPHSELNQYGEVCTYFSEYCNLPTEIVGELGLMCSETGCESTLNLHVNNISELPFLDCV